MNRRTIPAIVCIMLLVATTAMAQAPGGRRGGRGGPPGGRGPQPQQGRGGTAQIIDDIPLTSMQQGLDARAALQAYDQTLREQAQQARVALLDKMRSILNDQQFSQFKDELEQIPLVPQPAPQPRGVATTDLVDRVMSFDKDGDGKISQSELPERMVSLMSQGDTNHDGVLDREEIRALTTQNSVPQPPPGLGRRGGGPPPPPPLAAQ